MNYTRNVSRIVSEARAEINKTDYVIAALEFYNKHLKDETTLIVN